MYIEPSNRSKLAFTLPEVMIVVAISTLFLAGVISTNIFLVRSMASLSNYWELDMLSRQALQVMTADIRQAKGVSLYTTNDINFYYLTPGGGTYSIAYTYSPTQKLLSRVYKGNPQPLLKNCFQVTNQAGVVLPFFAVGQRNVTNGFDNYEPSTNNFNATIKVVQVNWICKREVVGAGLTETESVQTAKIVIRNQK